MIRPAMSTHPATGPATASSASSLPSSEDATVGDRLAAVRGRMAAAARRAGRADDDVLLVAVSKTWGIDRVAAAAAAGQRHFGESRAQELRDKLDRVDELPAGTNVDWHFVGRLQTNKVKYVVGACSLVHSLDRWELAEALAARADYESTTQAVLVQVNVDDDPRKAGVAPAEVPAFLDRLAALSAVRCRGLMTLPALGGDSPAAFAALRRLRDEVVQDHPDVTDLSMGMSRDYEEAIAEGATIVRIGEAVFGPRRQA